jgi:transposase-like protein
MGDIHSTDSWLTRPLCRRYVVAVFSFSTTRLKAEPASLQPVCWAMGSLINGEVEVLGAWLMHDVGLAPTAAAFGELHARGAEFVRVGVGLPPAAEQPFKNVYRLGDRVDSVAQLLEAAVAIVPRRHRMEVSAQLRSVAEAETLERARSELAKFQGTTLGESYPAVVQLWSEALAGFTPIFALSEQLRVLIRSTDQKAAQVRGQMTRAISRHGPFTDSGAALDFVVASLARTEQRWDRERAAARAARSPMAPRGFERRSGTLGVTTLA